MADPLAMCWTPVPPSVAHTASKPVCRVCPCHDNGMMRVMDGLMEGFSGTDEDKMVAHLTPNAIGRSWIAFALHMVHERLPQFGAANTVERLDGEHDVAQCGRVGTARFCRAPIMGRLAGGSSTPTNHPHGAGRMGSWLVRSHSGGGCSHVLHGCPTSPECTVVPDVFHTIAL